MITLYLVEHVDPLNVKDSYTDTHQYLEFPLFTIKNWNSLLSTNDECSMQKYHVLDEPDRKYDFKQHDDIPKSKFVK